MTTATAAAYESRTERLQGHANLYHDPNPTYKPYRKSDGSPLSITMEGDEAVPFSQLTKRHIMGPIESAKTVAVKTENGCYPYDREKAEQIARDIPGAEIVPVLEAFTYRDGEYAGTVTPEFVLRRWPRLVAHVMCYSSGYASPLCAARIIADMKGGRENYCEWIWSCHSRNPRTAVELAIVSRHHHRGFLGEYASALVNVMREHRGTNPTLGVDWC